MGLRIAVLAGTALLVVCCRPAGAAGITGIVIDTDGSINCSTYKTIADDVTAGCKTDKDKALAIFSFVVRTVYIPYQYDRPKEILSGSAQTVYDPLKIVNVYGAGGCGIQQVVFGSLLKAAGLEERALNPGFAHVSNEVEFDGKWHWLDTWLPLYLYDEKGDIYSYDELMADRTLITKAIEAGRTSRNYMYNPSDANGIVKAKGHSAGGSAARAQAYVENLCLRPGEQCTWMWDNVGQWCWPDETHPEGGPAFKFPADKQAKDAFPYWEPYKKTIKGGPCSWSNTYYRYYGNAVFASAPALTKDGLADYDAKLTNIAFAEGGGLKAEKPAAEAAIEIPFDLPYVIADTKVSGGVDLGKGAAVKFEYSLDNGKTWKPGQEISESGNFSFGLGKANDPKLPPGFTTGHYRFILKAALVGGEGGTAAVLKGLKVDNVTMLNFYSRPWLETGKNKVTVTAGGDLAKSPLKITWNWLEDWTEKKSFTQNVSKSGQQAVIEVGGSKRPKMESVTIACPR